VTLEAVLEAWARSLHLHLFGPPARDDELDRAERTLRLSS
jgi:hypothetical protein